MLSLLLPMLAIANIDAKNCFQRRYKTTRKEGAILSPNETISSHHLEEPAVHVKCCLLCDNESKCVGFNYRTATANDENCQLTNVTNNTNTTKTGYWTLYLDIEAANRKNEKNRGKDSGQSAVMKSCAKLYESGEREDGVYNIDPDGLGAFKVWCDMKNGGGWTVFQRRQDGSEDFYRDWSDYKVGFGDVNGEFWLGLDKLHRLSNSGQNVLRIDLMDIDGSTGYAKYESFSVASETDNYKLNVGKFQGDAGDSLTYHNGMMFSTKDRDNDKHYGWNCAERWKGAWWFNSCHFSDLNGQYLKEDSKSLSGIRWHRFKNDKGSFKNTEMKIRPTQF